MFKLIFTSMISLLLCSQAIGAVKWNNSSSKSCGEYEEKNVEIHSMNTPFSKEFKKLRKKMNKATNNGFSRFLMPTANNVRAKNSVTLEDFKGEHSIRLRFKPGDIGGPGDWRRFGEPGYAQRLQFFENDGGIQTGEEMWYRVGFYIPKDYFTSGHALSFFDFKPVKDCADIEAPVVSMNLRPEGLNAYIAGRYYYDKCVKNDVTKQCDKEEYVFEFGRGYKDQWIMLVMNVKWAEKDGFVKIWMNGNQVINFKGNLPVKEAEAVRFKFGPYRIDLDKDKTLPNVDIRYSGVGRAKTCEKLWKGCDRLLNNEIPVNSVRNSNNSKRGAIIQNVMRCDTLYSSASGGGGWKVECNRKPITSPFE